MPCHDRSVPIFYIWLARYSVYGMAVAIPSSSIMVVFGLSRHRSQQTAALTLEPANGRFDAGRCPAACLHLAALKVNIGRLWWGVIVGEFQSASEGPLSSSTAAVFKLNIVMTAIVVLAVLSGVMYLVIALEGNRASLFSLGEGGVSSVGHRSVIARQVCCILRCTAPTAFVIDCRIISPSRSIRAIARVRRPCSAVNRRRGTAGRAGWWCGCRPVPMVPMCSGHITIVPC